MLRALAIVVAMTASADAMVIIRYSWESSPVTGSLYATGELSDGTALGGGIALSFRLWTERWSERWMGRYFIDAKAGAVDAITPERPLELVLRVGAQQFDGDGYTFRATPSLPYVAVGVAMLVPGTKAGPVVVAGYERWLGERFGVFGEIELRLMFGHGTAEQACANLGLRMRL